MHTILIADDEQIIRQGLMCTLDWNELGFEIMGEAANGKEALDFILENNPDVAMLDIRMPKLNGLETAKQAREQGYKGTILILSGFSEFRYAKEAIKYGVKYYLNKPIDETELKDAILEIRNELDEQKKEEKTFVEYRARAKETILKDLLVGTYSLSQNELSNLNFCAKKYQVVLYESYSDNDKNLPYYFSDLFKGMGFSDSDYDTITLGETEALILKGTSILDKFSDFLERYDRDITPQTNSPLDTLFITYGEIVDQTEDIHISYNQALMLLNRRFFCQHKQHTFGYGELPVKKEQNDFVLSKDILETYREKLIAQVQNSMRNEVAQTLSALEKNLYQSNEDIPHIKLFLTDLYLSIKAQISHLHHNVSIPFPGNSDIIKIISEKNYLFEILLFFTEQFDMIIKSIGNPSKNTIMDDIIHYIENNYMENIKLETIAPLFGYNSSYLGKIFTKKVGMGFNIFVDQIRINHSKELLLNTDLKVYEIAEKVGYQHVDYFHTKFKKYVNQSPAEFRKNNR